MSKWNVDNLCKLRAAINERVILCRLTELDQKVEDVHDGGAQTRDSLQSNSQAKRVADLVYMIISKSPNLLHFCPRNSNSICTFVFHLIFLASKKVFKDPPS